MGGNAALILAGGSGVRLGGAIAKQYLDLGGRALLRHSAAAFAAHPAIDAVRVVIGADDGARYDQTMRNLDILDPVVGGARRQDSALNGLESLAEMAPERVLIHDAARPFVAAVAETIDRAGLWRAQTPQGFRYADILAAHRAAAGAALTDDAAVAERAGLEVALVMGSDDNVKVTTEADFERAQRMVAASPGEMRVGTGFDVHRFGAGDCVMLCGVAVPSDRGLEGHSDADVGLHALTDAVLGAAGAGDIGMHFPPTDPKWRDAASEVFLRHAAALVRKAGGDIVNVDVTLICERPRIGPHRDDMVARVADILAIGRRCVSVKATTTEGLGFTGRGDGIAAQAVATIRLPS